MLYNREAILTFVMDKYRVREYVVKKGGAISRFHYYGMEKNLTKFLLINYHNRS